MIRHIVLFSLASTENLETVLAGLRRLAEIPQARALEVMPNLKRDPFGNGFDVVVHALFDDRAALDAFQAHPLYAEVIAIVRPLRKDRVAADFVTTI
jgi:hypothetical protein